MPNVFFCLSHLLKLLPWPEYFIIILSSGKMEPEEVEIPTSTFSRFSSPSLQDPVITVDGFTFERKAIETWFNPMINELLFLDSRLEPFFEDPDLGVHRKVTCAVTVRSSNLDSRKGKESTEKCHHNF